LLGGWCGCWDISEHVMNGAHNIFDTHLRFYKIAIGTKLFAALALVFA
jgi:hypothetical protein